MWKAEFFKNTILKPVLERLAGWGVISLMWGGNWLCETLNACGVVTQNGASMVMAWVSAVGVLIFELMLSWMNRKSAERKAVAKAVAGKS